MTKTTHTTREGWLVAAIEGLAPLFKQQGHKLPPVRVAAGWPSSRALSAKHRRIGECWHADASADKHNEIFVSPILADPAEVLSTLAHELCHAVLPKGVGHKAPFARLALAIGLEGKPTSTVAGEAFKRATEGLLKELGRYPHAVLDSTAQRKKQTTRLRLWTCGCPVKVRVASDAFAAHCDICGEPFEHVE